MAPKETPRTPQHAEGVHVQRPQSASVRPAEPAQAPPVSGETAQAAPARPGEFVLPPSVISRADIGKCTREIEKISDFFHQEGLRGSKDQPLPTLSRTLESLAAANGLNLIHTEDRDTLHGFLVKIKAKAPSVHMSFPSEASDDFVAKLLEWFRTQVHPHIVLNVGLQPELAAGCTLRTTNKFYDFSFRARFEASKAKLLSALEELDAKAGPLEPQAAAPTPDAATPDASGSTLPTPTTEAATAPAINPATETSVEVPTPATAEPGKESL